MNEEIRYQDRVCLFLDILGFKEHVNETYKKEVENIEKVNEIANLLSSLPLSVRSVELENMDRQITQFSDSIVVSFRLDDKNAFLYLIEDLMSIIINFLNKDYLVRGGISYGKLFHNKNLVFGPAMNTAYELESKVAIYPRIIFDKELVLELIKNGDKELEGIEQGVQLNTANVWKEDFDGKYYLNYFEGAIHFLKQDSHQYYDYLMQLRTLINTAWKNRTSLTVRAKYGWLRTKFNELVNDIDNSTSIDFRIKKI